MHAASIAPDHATSPAAGTYNTCLRRPGLTTAADAQGEGRSVPMPDPTPPFCLPPLPEPEGERTDGRVQPAACSAVPCSPVPGLAGLVCMGAVCCCGSGCLLSQAGGLTLPQFSNAPFCPAGQTTPAPASAPEMQPGTPAGSTSSSRGQQGNSSSSEEGAAGSGPAAEAGAPGVRLSQLASVCCESTPVVLPVCALKVAGHAHFWASLLRPAAQLPVHVQLKLTLPLPTVTRLPAPCSFTSIPAIH